MIIKVFLLVLAVAAVTCDDAVKTYPGKPVAIWSFATGNLELNTKKLDAIFGHEALAGRKVVVYAIDGAKGEGKSLFMDYMLRYMYKTFKSVASPEKPFNHDHADWLGGQEEPLQGFTTNKLEVGVSMWSDIFLHDAPNGDKFAIVIAESKTVSDPKWTYADNSMFFFLNAMVSSVQIFNLKASLEEKHLDYFKFVAKFGKLGLEGKGLDEPFGKLIFLTRDSVDPHYGFEAGKSKEENLWKVKEKDSDEHKSWIESANNAFTGFSNYQMIAPGPKIHEKDFDGRRSQLDHAFVDQIKDFAEHVLSADKLNVKKIHKEFLDVSKYYAYLKKYEQIMKTDDLKSVAAIYNAKI